MRPRAITGVGVASAAGVGRAAFFEAMRSGACPEPKDGQLAVPDFDATKYLGDKGLRSLDRLTKLLVVATRLALHDAGLKKENAWVAAQPEQVGIVVSNAYGSLEAITELDRVSLLEDARYINPSRFPLTVANSAAGYASIWEELRAVNVSVSDGNCGALDAAACADVLLDQARAGALLVGGAEALSEALVLAFQKLGAAPSRPRERGRTDGACLGEAAALLVLEAPEGARARAAEVLGEVFGYGTAFEPPAREAALVHAAPESVERAISGALDDAGITAGDVDVVVSGLAGLRAYDEAEMLAIRHTVGDEACVVAPKKALGETLGAGGALGMISALAYLHEGARSHVVRGTLPAKPRTALVVSMGYYGNASAVVMRSI